MRLFTHRRHGLLGLPSSAWGSYPLGPARICILQISRGVSLGARYKEQDKQSTQPFQHCKQTSLLAQAFEVSKAWRNSYTSILILQSRRRDHEILNVSYCNTPASIRYCVAISCISCRGLFTSPTQNTSDNRLDITIGQHHSGYPSIHESASTRGNKRHQGRRCWSSDRV